MDDSTQITGHHRVDVEELSEWSQSFEELMRERGAEGASAVLRMLGERASAAGIGGVEPVTTDYVNTIPVDEEPDFPGDEDHFLRALITQGVLTRWALQLLEEQGSVEPGTANRAATKYCLLDVTAGTIGVASGDA